MIKIFDGAMGTMLQAAGLKPGECPELLNINQPDVVKAVHEAYINAGADIIETNTFGANRIKLEHYGLSERAREINIAAVQTAKAAAGKQAQVAGSMHSRPLACIEQPILDTGLVRIDAHFTAKSIQLADQVSLRRTTNGWITRHLRYIIKIQGCQQGPAAHARGCQGCLHTGMTGTNYNYIIISRNKQNISLLFTNTELAEYLVNYIFSYRIAGNFTKFFPSTAQINYNKISRECILYCLGGSR